VETAERILRDAKTIAVVGLSRDPAKTAHAVPRALQSFGYRIVPVTPHTDELLGERAYASLTDVPDEIDVVEVFRPSAEAPAIARQAVAQGAKALWLQQGIVSDEARRIAEEGGLDYVEDQCMAVARARFGIRPGRETAR
jgi:predicted CoA-binding protein